MRAVKGKTICRSVPREMVEETLQQVAEYQRFRLLLKDWVEVSDAIGQQKVAARRETARAEAKKKPLPPSSRRSDRRLPPKSNSY